MRSRPGGSFSGWAGSCSQARHVERAISCSLACQRHGHRLQPLECEFLRLAQVGAVELPTALLIGAPVQFATPVAGPLFARGEEALLTAKGEGRGRLEPGIPVGGVHHDLYGRLVPQVGEDAILDDRRDLSHCSLPLLLSSTEQGFPNSIAYVREPLLEAFVHPAREWHGSLQQEQSLVLLMRGKELQRRFFTCFFRTRTKGLCSTSSR